MKINIFKYEPIIKDNLVEKFKFCYLIEDGIAEYGGFQEINCEVKKILEEWSEESIFNLFYDWFYNNYDKITQELQKDKKFKEEMNVR